MEEQIEDVELQTNTTDEETEPQTNSEEENDEPSEKEKRLYARLKKAEEKLALKEIEAKEAKKQADPNDVDKILEITAATKELSSTEIAELKFRSQVTGKTLLEARDDPNFKIWQTAYKTKVEEEQKQLSPSTTQDTAKDEVKPFHSLSQAERKESLDNMTDDESEAWLDGLKVGGVPIEKIQGKGGATISPDGIAAFKKERTPKPIDDDSIRVGENPQLR